VKRAPQRRTYNSRVNIEGSHAGASTPLNGGDQRIEDRPAGRLLQAVRSPWAEVRPLDLEENSIVAWFPDGETAICSAAGKEGEPWIGVNAVCTSNRSRKLLEVAFGDRGR
jgi:hypothetical protein